MSKIIVGHNHTKSDSVFLVESGSYNSYASVHYPDYQTQLLMSPKASIDCYKIIPYALEEAIRNKTSDHLAINNHASQSISECLSYGSFEIRTHKDLILVSNITWTNSSNSFSIISSGNIGFKDTANLECGGDLILKAGIEGTGTERVVFETSQPQIYMQNDKTITIHYNPDREDKEHKYHNPSSYRLFVTPPDTVTSYILINNSTDLQKIMCFPSGNYALANDINITKDTQQRWHPISIEHKSVFFYGNFDGNGYTISNLYISRPEEDDVGLFATILGHGEEYPSEIKNLVLKDVYVEGAHRVGALAGCIVYANLINVCLEGEITIVGKEIVGGITGSLWGTNLLSNCSTNPNITIFCDEYCDKLIGVHRPFESMCEDQ